MPANKKYLLRTRLGRTSKILAATIGSLLCSVSFHVALLFFFDKSKVLATALYSIFISWVLLMLMVYYIKKPWLSWAMLIAIFIVSAIGISIAKSLN
ncbi:MAG: hypothetical protein AAGA02_03440 [Bacteroidota bacterium]